MDEPLHSKLTLLQSIDLGERTAFCPDALVIAQYFDRVLEDEKLDSLEHHLSSCRYCQAQIGMLHRLAEREADLVVPPDALASAKKLRPAKVAKRSRKQPAWAAAAAVMLAVTAVALWQQSPTPVNVSEAIPADSTESPRQLRSLGRSDAPLELSMDPVLGPGAIIRWVPIEDSVHYTIFILSDEGDILGSRRLSKAEWTFSNEWGLEPEASYFLRVEAMLRNGSQHHSSHQIFSVSEAK